MGLENIQAQVANEIDQTKFEDECRYYFGLKSYFLFTIDKLLILTMKRVQSILASAICSKFLALYSYEKTRSNGLVEEIYHHNASLLLNVDEKCYRFKTFTENGNLCLSICRADQADVALQDTSSLQGMNFSVFSFCVFVVGSLLSASLLTSLAEEWMFGTEEPDRDGQVHLPVCGKGILLKR